MKTKIAELTSDEFNTVMQYGKDYNMHDMDMQSVLNNYLNHYALPDPEAQYATPQQVHTNTQESNPQLELLLEDPYKL